MSDHNHRVEDTRKRSLFKALTSNGLEVLIDTILIGVVLSALGMPYAFEFAGGFSIVTEICCFVTNYLNDRVWNKVQWGRKVIEYADNGSREKEVGSGT